MVAQVRPPVTLRVLTVIVSGLEYVGEVPEEERTTLCGRRYQHDPQRTALRAGSVMSSLTANEIDYHKK
jgi:hypothetical protein